MVDTLSRKLTKSMSDIVGNSEGRVGDCSENEAWCKTAGTRGGRRGGFFTNTFVQWATGVLTGTLRLEVLCFFD